MKLLKITGLFLMVVMACAALTTSCMAAMVQADNPAGAARFVYGDVPPWAPPAGQQARFKYQYFPSAQVYYEPMREVFFYRENGRWIKSPVLPRYLRSRLGDFVVLEMNTATPYIFQAQVSESYPPGSPVMRERRSGPPTSRIEQVPAPIYRYRYYSKAKVYFDPARNLYFYPIRGQWKESPVLPPFLRKRLGDFIIVEMNTATPYAHQPDVERLPATQPQRATAEPAGPPPWQPSAYGPVYHYDYYPTAFIYFDVDRRVYFYQMDDGRWVQAKVLQENLADNLGTPVMLEMNTDRPYIYQAQVMARYPHPGMEINKEVYRFYNTE